MLCENIDVYTTEKNQMVKLLIDYKIDKKIAQHRLTVLLFYSNKNKEIINMLLTYLNPDILTAFLDIKKYVDNTDVSCGSTNLKNENSVNVHKNEPVCVCCMVNPDDYAYTKCGHKCVCFECSQKLNNCPICRKKSGVIKIISCN